MLKDKRIFVAGHRGLIGSAVVKNLKERGVTKFITATRQEVDLLNQDAIFKFLDSQKPDVVFICAAKVGGIQANNTLRADFIYQNLQIQNNVIWGSHRANVEQVVFLGSSCIYPRNAAQPMQENALLTGELEFTNRPYAIAKIAGMELINSLCQQYGRKYFSAMPTNLYGPRDDYSSDNSHVMPALIRRIHEAKIKNQSEVAMWGTGKPMREFLYSDDCADAIVHLAETIDEDFFKSILATKQQYFHVNIGSGEEISILNLAKLIAEIVGYSGKIVLDTSKPDGTPRKLMDSKLLFSFGWRPKTSLRAGIEKSYRWYLENETQPHG